MRTLGTFFSSNAGDLYSPMLRSRKRHPVLKMSSCIAQRTLKVSRRKDSQVENQLFFFFCWDSPDALSDERHIGHVGTRSNTYAEKIRSMTWANDLRIQRGPWMDGRKNKSVSGWISEWVIQWVNEWRAEWMDEWICDLWKPDRKERRVKDAPSRLGLLVYSWCFGQTTISKQIELVKSGYKKKMSKLPWIVTSFVLDVLALWANYNTEKSDFVNPRPRVIIIITIITEWAISKPERTQCSLNFD